eukprot:TRINITY_DN448_c0_g1_i1.p1 TRINITY_DN448_c0_g1~~TRINITY_DN448_c0_g1_i1.p1  ORF type:complete len:293 (+),score=50.73 TRINITY_DN448_c0_g1_i1:135-1013(+)
MQHPAEELADVLRNIRHPDASGATSVNEARRAAITRYCAPDVLFVHSLYQVSGADALAAVLTMAAASHLTMNADCPPPLMPPGWEDENEEVTCMIELLQEFRTWYNPLRKVSTNMWVEIQLRPMGRGTDRMWVISQITDHYTLSHVASLSFFASILYLTVFCFCSFIVGSILTPLTTNLYPSLRGKRTYRSFYSRPSTPKRRDTPIPLRRGLASSSSNASPTSSTSRPSAVGKPSPLSQLAYSSTHPTSASDFEDAQQQGEGDDSDNTNNGKARRGRRKSIMDEEGGHARYY